METQSEQVNTGENITDEFKLIALFSHLSILFGSLIVPLVLWALYKEKSKFVSFHSMQALIFHIAYIVMMVFVVIAVSTVILLTGAGGSKMGHSQPLGAFQIIMLIFVSLFVIVYVFGSIGLGIYTGIKSYRGEMSKYPIIGNIVYNKVYAKSV